MVFFSCEGKRDCIVLSVIASVIIGVVAALLRITGIIATTTAFLWVVFGVAVGYLGVLLATYLLREQPTACGAGSTLSALLTGILGSILLSVVLLAIPFAATSIVGAILVGLLLLFFSLIFTASACLVKCLAAA